MVPLWLNVHVNNSRVIFCQLIGKNIMDERIDYFKRLSLIVRVNVVLNRTVVVDSD